MLVNLAEITKIAEEKKCAVGAINTPNLESLLAALRAAEELGEPVIIAHAEVHEPYIHIEEIGPIMVDMAKKAKVPVCVHLDHGTDFDLIMRALRIGFTSVMYDGSVLPYEENVKNSAEVVRIAHAMGASVEAELGRMLAAETGAAQAAPVSDLKPEDCYTDPDTAKDFVDRTGVDALAISFGTAHGIYTAQPKLDFSVIERVRANVGGLPLVMHGGSGVSAEGYRTAIEKGIRKINYYTYMSVAGGNFVKELVREAGDGVLYFHDVACRSIDAMKQDILKAMRGFYNK